MTKKSGTTLVLVPSPFEFEILTGKAPQSLPNEGLPYLTQGPITWCLGGVGPAAAGACAMAALAKFIPDRLVLAGIAGAFQPSGLVPGQVVQVALEILADTGYLRGNVPVTLDEMGLPQTLWQGQPLGAQFHCDPLNPLEPSVRAVTVASVTSSAERAQQLWLKFAPAIENMEGAAVALACHLQQTPFFQVRGISNFTGPRQPETWLIKPALENLRTWLQGHL